MIRHPDLLGPLLLAGIVALALAVGALVFWRLM